MKLDQFVQESLENITKGVQRAKDSNVNIAPQLRDGDDDLKTHRTRPGGAAVFLVEFDVAVTVSDSSGASGGGGITVFSVATLKADKNTRSEASTVSRIRFSVPVSFG